MIAQFNGSCRECGAGIESGEEAHYAHGVLTCLDCGPADADAHRGSATGMEDAPGYVRVLEKRIDALEEKHAHDILAVMKRMDALFGWANGLSTELDIPAPVVGA